MHLAVEEIFNSITQICICPLLIQIYEYEASTARLCKAEASLYIKSNEKLPVMVTELKKTPKDV